MITFLEFPKGFKHSVVRYITSLVVLIIASYATDCKLYLLSNSLLTLLLTFLYADTIGYVICYSGIIGMGVFGYYNFKTYSPKYPEPYKYTGYGILIAIIASLASHFIANYFIDTD